MPGYDWETGIALSILFLLLGSFMNVVGIRTALGESLIWPRSRCRGCGAALQARDLIPVLSYIWSRGRCRHCKEAVSPVYPLGELASMLMGLLLFKKYGLTPEFVLLSVLFLMGIAVSASDVFFMKIPNKITFPMMILFFAGRVIYHPEGLFFYLGGGVLGGGLLLLLALLYPKGMGGGDVKLFFLMGLGIGFLPTLIALFLASLLGSLWGIGLLILKKKKNGDPVPFGPFIVLASFIGTVWGTPLWQLYWNLQYK